MSTIRSRWLGRLAARRRRLSRDRQARKSAAVLRRDQVSINAAVRVVHRHPPTASTEARRKTGAKGLSLIKQAEGLRLHPYRLPGERYWTVGYGHYGPDVKPAQSITAGDASRLLAHDIRWAEDAVRAVGVPLNQYQFDALVSLTFNLGAGILGRTHTVGAKLRKRDYPGVAAAIELYNKDSRGVVLRGLQERRAAERRLFEGRA